MSSSIDRLLKIQELEELIGVHRATIYRHIKNKNFPKPLKIGNSSRWKESEVKEWIESQKRGVDVIDCLCK